MSLGTSSYGLEPYVGHSVEDVSTHRSSGPPRTPSPTPSELIEEREPFSIINFKKALDYKNWRITRKAIPWIIVGVILGTVVLLMSIFHHQIVDWLTPFSKDLKKMPAGWIIPIVILFVISFPPLFGHEIVAILCGIVWGLWKGFAIVAVGTLLGELGNFYVFRYFLTKRGEKLERTNLKYAALAKLIRKGGYLIPIVVRFSAIPGHFTTAVFSTCGMSVWIFIISALVSSPKQLTTVYLGVVIENSNTSSKKNTIISDIVLVVSILVTVAAAHWILGRMTMVKPEVMRDMRRRRALEKWELDNGYESTDRLALRAFDADESDEERSVGLRQPTPLKVPGGRYEADGGPQISQLYDPPPVSQAFNFDEERSRRQSGEDLAWDSNQERSGRSRAPESALSGSNTGSPVPRPVFYSPPPGAPPPRPFQQPASVPAVQSEQYQPQQITPPKSNPSSPPQLVQPKLPRAPAVPAHVPRYGLRDDGPVPAAAQPSSPPSSYSPPRIPPPLEN